MLQPIEITEVNGRARSGISARPFLCRGADGCDYFVKLGNVHAKGLISEWLCAQLAKQLELPVADFRLVQVAEDFSDLLDEEFSEIGSGIGFGSVAAPPGSRDMLQSDTDKLEKSMLADVIVFDAWIRNEDRKLGRSGGNPNALFAPSNSPPLVLIDHDSAFDNFFDESRFMSDHIGRGAVDFWLDKERRRIWTNRATNALQGLPDMWNTIPDEWIEDKFGDPKEVPSLSDIQVFLSLPFENPEKFWNSMRP